MVMGEVIDSDAPYEPFVLWSMPRTAQCIKFPGHHFSGSLGNMGDYRLCPRNVGGKLRLSSHAIVCIESNPNVFPIVASHF